MGGCRTDVACEQRPVNDSKLTLIVTRRHDWVREPCPDLTHRYLHLEHLRPLGLARWRLFHSMPVEGCAYADGHVLKCLTCVCVLESPARWVREELPFQPYWASVPYHRPSHMKPWGGRDYLTSPNQPAATRASDTLQHLLTITLTLIPERQLALDLGSIDLAPPLPLRTWLGRLGSGALPEP